MTKSNRNVHISIFLWEAILCKGLIAHCTLSGSLPVARGMMERELSRDKATARCLVTEELGLCHHAHPQHNIVQQV